MPIGEKLAQIIEEKGRNVNDISIATGIKPQTIYSIIKRDNTRVDLDNLFALCDELGISIDTFRSEDIPSLFAITVEERALIVNFRAAAPEDREMILRVAALAAKVSNAEHLAESARDGQTAADSLTRQYLQAQSHKETAEK